MSDLDINVETEPTPKVHIETANSNTENILSIKDQKLPSQYSLG